ncbi:hypothetical protein ACFL09_01005 [Planctomycetota bacterium]
MLTAALGRQTVGQTIFGEIAMWDAQQTERLEFERQLLEKYMPNFQMDLQLPDNAYVDGWVMTSGGTNWYRLWIAIPGKYPYVAPDLYVMHPHPLPTHGGKRTVNSLKGSGAFHVYNNGKDGYVWVCHTHSWDASMNCINVLMRGFIWLEAYEGHLATGRDLAEFLNPPPKRRRWWW